MTRRRHLLDSPAPAASPVALERVLTMLVRSWCSLCDEMRDAVAPIARRHGFEVAEIDLDAHPEWEARYGEVVPVLFAGTVPDGEVLAELRADAAALEQRLTGIAFASGREIR